MFIQVKTRTDLCYYKVCSIGESVCSCNQLSTKLSCTAQVAGVIQLYIVLLLIEVLDITGQKPCRKSELESGLNREYGWGNSTRSTETGRPAPQLLVRFVQQSSVVTGLCWRSRPCLVYILNQLIPSPECVCCSCVNLIGRSHRNTADVDLSPVCYTPTKQLLCVHCKIRYDTL